MKEVSGKICLRYLTRHWKKHPKLGKEKLRQFLHCYYRGDENPAKKAFAQITHRGMGSLELLMVADLLDEWWKGEWKFKKRELVRLKGEWHRRRRKNLKKANKAKSQKAQLKRRLEKQRKREEKQREEERIKRAFEKLLKPQVFRPYI
jgi:hypothetical protein